MPLFYSLVYGSMDHEWAQNALGLCKLRSDNPLGNLLMLVYGETLSMKRYCVSGKKHGSVSPDRCDPIKITPCMEISDKGKNMPRTRSKTGQKFFLGSRCKKCMYVCSRSLYHDFACASRTNNISWTIDEFLPITLFYCNLWEKVRDYLR